MAVYLNPIDVQNSAKTLEYPISRAILLTRAEAVPALELAVSKYRSGEAVYCWATGPRNRSMFGKMKPGDVIFFSKKGTGTFGIVASIVDTIESLELSKTLWGNLGAENRCMIYFLRNPQKINVPKILLLRSLGYEKTDRLQRLRMVAHTRVDAALSNNDLPSSVVRWLKKGRFESAN